VGESLGGWICGLYAAELSLGAHMIPVEKLVLVDAAGLKQDKPIPDLNPGSLAGMRALMQAVFYDTSWLSEDALRKVFTDKLATHDGYTIRSLLSNPALRLEGMDNQLANIKVPTLVLWGKQDSLLPIAAGERYAAGISGARLASFDKCGHVPAMEKTEEFLSAVNGFLASSAAAAH
jgi:pimeloyl-ACP methyl ester carboxylesterase